MVNPRGCKQCEPFTVNLYTCKVVGCKNGPSRAEEHEVRYRYAGNTILNGMNLRTGAKLKEAYEFKMFGVSLQTGVWLHKHASSLTTLTFPVDMSGKYFRLHAPTGYEVSWGPDNNWHWGDFVMTSSDPSETVYVRRK